MREAPKYKWVLLPLFLLSFFTCVSSGEDDTQGFPQGWLGEHERQSDSLRESGEVKRLSLKQLSALRSSLSKHSVLVVVFTSLDSNEQHEKGFRLPGKRLLQETSQILKDDHISFVYIPLSPRQLPVHQLGVHKTETILVFTDSQVTQFHGLHQPEVLISFLHHLRAPPVTTISEKKQKRALKRTDGIKVEGYFEPNSSELEVFTQVAKSFHPYVPFYAVYKEEVAKHLKLESLGSVNIWLPCCTNPHLIEQINDPEDFKEVVNSALRSPLKKLSASDIYADSNYDASKFTILAFVDRSTVHGFHFSRTIRKVMNKVRDAETLNVLWINIVEYPMLIPKWEKIFKFDLKIPQMGLVNLTDRTCEWIDSEKILGKTGEDKMSAVGKWIRYVIRGGIRVDGLPKADLDEEEEWQIEGSKPESEENNNNNDEHDENGEENGKEKEEITKKVEMKKVYEEEGKEKKEKKAEDEEKRKSIKSKYRKNQESERRTEDKYKDKHEKDEDDDEKEDLKGKGREKESKKKSTKDRGRGKISKKDFQKRNCNPSEPSADCSLFTWIWWLIKQIFFYFRSLIFPANNTNTTVIDEVRSEAKNSEKDSTLKHSHKARPIPVPESEYPVPPGADGDFFMSYDDDDDDISDMFEAGEKADFKDKSEKKRKKDYAAKRIQQKKGSKNDDFEKEQEVKSRKTEDDEDESDDFFVSYDDEEDLSDMFENRYESQDNQKKKYDENNEDEEDNDKNYKSKYRDEDKIYKDREKKKYEEYHDKDEGDDLREKNHKDVDDHKEDNEERDNEEKEEMDDEDEGDYFVSYDDEEDISDMFESRYESKENLKKKYDEDEVDDERKKKLKKDDDAVERERDEDTDEEEENERNTKFEKVDEDQDGDFFVAYDDEEDISDMFHSKYKSDSYEEDLKKDIEKKIQKKQSTKKDKLEKKKKHYKTNKKTEEDSEKDLKHYINDDFFVSNYDDDEDLTSMLHFEHTYDQGMEEESRVDDNNGNDEGHQREEVTNDKDVREEKDFERKQKQQQRKQKKKEKVLKPETETTGETSRGVDFEDDFFIPAYDDEEDLSSMLSSVDYEPPSGSKRPTHESKEKPRRKRSSKIPQPIENLNDEEKADDFFMSGYDDEEDLRAMMTFEEDGRPKKKKRDQNDIESIKKKRFKKNEPVQDKVTENEDGRWKVEETHEEKEEETLTENDEFFIPGYNDEEDLFSMLTSEEDRHPKNIYRDENERKKGKKKQDVKTPSEQTEGRKKKTKDDRKFDDNKLKKKKAKQEQDEDISIPIYDDDEDLSEMFHYDEVSTEGGRYENSQEDQKHVSEADARKDSGDLTDDYMMSDYDEDDDLTTMLSSVSSNDDDAISEETAEDAVEIKEELKDDIKDKAENDANDDEDDLSIPIYEEEDDLTSMFHDSFAAEDSSYGRTKEEEEEYYVFDSEDVMENTEKKEVGESEKHSKQGEDQDKYDSEDINSYDKEENLDEILPHEDGPDLSEDNAGQDNGLGLDGIEDAENGKTSILQDEEDYVISSYDDEEDLSSMLTFEEESHKYGDEYSDEEPKQEEDKVSEDNDDKDNDDDYVISSYDDEDDLTTMLTFDEETSKDEHIKTEDGLITDSRKEQHLEKEKEDDIDEDNNEKEKDVEEDDDEDNYAFMKYDEDDDLDSIFDSSEEASKKMKKIFKKKSPRKKQKILKKMEETLDCSLTDEGKKKRCQFPKDKKESIILGVMRRVLAHEINDIDDVKTGGRLFKYEDDDDEDDDDNRKSKKYKRDNYDKNYKKDKKVEYDKKENYRENKKERKKHKGNYKEENKKHRTPEELQYEEEPEIVSWEETADVDDISVIIDEFHEKVPEAPRIHSSVDD